MHDVLLVHGGIALVRNRALPVRSVEGAVTPAPNVKGGETVSVRFRLDDDSIVEVAAGSVGSDLVAAPFQGSR